MKRQHSCLAKWALRTFAPIILAVTIMASANPSYWITSFWVLLIINLIVAGGSLLVMWKFVSSDTLSELRAYNVHAKPALWQVGTSAGAHLLTFILLSSAGCGILAVLWVVNVLIGSLEKALLFY
jgi:hypothetical protein